jgi:Collagen triple helix repeat (20 copies)
MRRRLSYANVTATLALVFAMSGGAMAANHYLITSTKQISPKVLKKLTGKTGAPGANGAIGVTGVTGPQGPTGKEGTLGKEGSVGKEGKEGPPGPGIKWALVKGDGTSIIAQSGGISISSHFTGGYYLNFGSPVAGHAISVTVHYTGFPAGPVDTAPCGGGVGGAPPDAVECLVPGTNDVNHVFVNTLNEKGVLTDKTFYIEVFQ